MDDSESTPLPSLWETVLKLLLTVEKASTFVNLPSYLTQRFLNLLSGGCYGNAYKIGPLLLPLMKVLREQASNNAGGFDQQVVSSICNGFNVRTVTTSSREALALSSSLFQIIEFIAKCTTTEGDESRVTTLFKNQVNSLLNYWTININFVLIAHEVHRNQTATIKY